MCVRAKEIEIRPKHEGVQGGGRLTYAYIRFRAIIHGGGGVERDTKENVPRGERIDLLTMKPRRDTELPPALRPIRKSLRYNHPWPHAQAFV